MKNSKYLFIVLVFGLLLQSCKSYTSNIIFKAEPTDMNWKSAYEGTTNKYATNSRIASALNSDLLKKYNIQFTPIKENRL